MVQIRDMHFYVNIIVALIIIPLCVWGWIILENKQKNELMEKIGMQPVYTNIQMLDMAAVYNGCYKVHICPFTRESKCRLARFYARVEKADIVQD